MIHGKEKKKGMGSKKKKTVGKKESPTQKAKRLHKKMDSRYKDGVRSSGLKIKKGPTKGRPRKKGKK
jgi:hypothetical protein